MNNKNELLKQALDAIEGLFYGHEELDRQKVISIVEEIELELSKPEQDPVAWMTVGGDGFKYVSADRNQFVTGEEGLISLYASPQQQQKPLAFLLKTHNMGQYLFMSENECYKKASELGATGEIVELGKIKN